MKKQTVNEIIACLPRERTFFSYFPGRYALALLMHEIKRMQAAERQQDATSAHTIRTLKASGFSQLLEKPVVKAALANCGDRVVDAATFDHWPNAATTDFLLGLTGWGDERDRRYHQTSRCGHNLVLQLNLNTGDMSRFAALVDYPDSYNCSIHPSCAVADRRYRITLAWARLDVDFASDQVLIEEIQSDFVRLVEWQREQHADHAAVQAFCSPFKKVWQEAMLCAAIEFIWYELGISRIFYHEFKTGAALKGLKYSLPPRSIYETLPRRFCMALTDEAPKFLLQQNAARKTLRRLAAPRFYTL